MDRLTILDQIGEDLKDKLKASRGYNFTPVEVKRGSYKWNDFSIYPVICYTMFRDVADENVESGDDSRWMLLYFYGYAMTDGIGDTTDIHKLAEDVDNFLFSTDFTYTDRTLVGDIEIKEGGVSDPVNSFLIEVRIEYDKK